MDPRDLAERLVDGLTDGPAAAVWEFGGPEVLRFGELARRWQRAHGSSRPVLPLRLPGRIARGVRAGALTTTVRPTGTRSWDDYLAERYGV